MGYQIAIDFGTTNSVVALYDEGTGTGKTVAVPGLSASLNESTHLIPSLLFVNDGRTGQVTLGASVRTARLDQLPGDRLFRNFKRSIGADRSEPRLIDGAPWTDTDAGQAFLRHLIASLPYPVEEIEQLVVTVPVAAFEGYTAWLQKAFAGFPADRVRIVDESTAAALGYAVTEPGAIVLVIDFGGGSLDLSLVRLPESREKTGKTLFTAVSGSGYTASVIAKAGMVLGGSDIDRWLVEWVLEHSGFSSVQPGSGSAELLSACEQAKIVLSAQEAAEVCFHQEDGSEKEVTLTRLELEMVMERHGFYRSLKTALDQVMGLAHQKGVYREDIGHVLLVGGTSLIPSVQKTLDDYFRAITERHHKLTDIPEWPALTWKVDKTTIRVDKPFTAVVEGALQVSAGFGLDDHLAHGYGLYYLDPQSGQVGCDEMIPMGSKYPSEKPVSVTLSPSCANQVEIALVVGQIRAGAIHSIDVQDQGGQAVFVARPEENAGEMVPLNSHAPLIIPLQPAGQPGKERLQADFRVDQARALRVTITDLETRRKLIVDTLVCKLGALAFPHSEKPADWGSFPKANLPALGKQSMGLFRLSLQKLNSIFRTLPPEQLSSGVLAETLRSDDCLVRFSAAETLAKRGDREARLLFEDILKNGLPHQRASAAQHIYHFSWFTAGPLFEIALSDPDPRTREAAVFGLCKMRLPDAYRRVMDILHTGTEAMRRAAVWGLYSHPDAAAVPVLALLAQAENVDIRAQVMEVLGLTASAEAIPVVQTAVYDPSPEVIYAATLSWVELAGSTCFLPLAEAIETSAGLDRRAILRGLFHATNYMGIDCGSSPAAERLVEALEVAVCDSLPAARIIACMQLAWMHHPRAEEVLLSAFHEEPDSTTRAQMLTSIVSLMSPAAKMLLAESLSSPDQIVRQTAEYLKTQHE